MVIEPFLFVLQRFGTLFLWKYVNPVQFYYLRKNLRPSLLLDLLRVTLCIFNFFISEFYNCRVRDNFVKRLGQVVDVSAIEVKYYYYYYLLRQATQNITHNFNITTSPHNSN